MEVCTGDMTDVFSNRDSEYNTAPSDSPTPVIDELQAPIISKQSSEDSSSEDDSIFRKHASKKRGIMSDSEEEPEQAVSGTKSPAEETESLGEVSANENETKSGKSRILTHFSSDGSNAESEDEQDSRIKNKSKKLKNKFSQLVKSRSKENKGNGDSDHSAEKDEMSEQSAKSDKSDEDEMSNDDLSSVNRIKQIIKEGTHTFKSTICDPDTSDEEKSPRKTKFTEPIRRKKTKPTSPKPMRMTAKQAMENMQKIKSESNRMLREKEVTLPYHRPKALNIKDIMNRRKPALTTDGKAMPLKMNEEQLKQYVALLEQRQKEVIELCKSESDQDDDDDDTCDKEVGSITKDEDEQIKEVRSITKDEDELMKEVQSITKDEDEQMKEVEPNENANDEAFNEVSTMECSEVINVNDIQNVIEPIGDIPSKENESVNHSEEITRVNEDLIQTNSEIVKNITETEIDEGNVDTTVSDEQNNTNLEDVAVTANKEQDSQLISLQYDSEKMSVETEILDEKADTVEAETKSSEEPSSTTVNASKTMVIDTEFSDDDDDDINMEDIDNIIANADLMHDSTSKFDSPMLVKDFNIKAKPRLTGAPGMVIDLDGNDAMQPKTATGVDLLKERFTYFAKLKTSAEEEQSKEKTQKPGTQHQKLKQVLEEQMAEQRSLEWAKRLEDEKKEKKELSVLRGDAPDEEDDLEKIEAQLEKNHGGQSDGDNNENEDNDEVESDDDLPEDDLDMTDKHKKKNPLLEDEAEESDCDEASEMAEEQEVDKGQNSDDDVEDAGGDDESSEESSSSDDEANDNDKPKKSRILKAFEDSDDEAVDSETIDQSKEMNNIDSSGTIDKVATNATQGSQDDVIQLAQTEKSFSEDLFTSQESDIRQSGTVDVTKDVLVENTQPTNVYKEAEMSQTYTEQINVITETQPFDEAKLNEIAGMCSGSFSQSIDITQKSTTQTQSLDLGDDVLALCTGKFYDSEFVSQTNVDIDKPTDDTESNKDKENDDAKTERHEDKSKESDKNILQSILEELDGPESEERPNKFFTGDNLKEGSKDIVSKKRFIIDSDEEDGTEDKTKEKETKKRKKRKLEDRALQISDDEEEGDEGEESDIDNDEEDRLVDYDSEENEIEIQPARPLKSSKKVSDFFEQEAELTSDDEWAGSGDEDERGDDRLEREDGDDDVFQHGKLVNELGQIHARELLDQDKREVRLLQELLFEDGDLGGGHRQRRFKWKNVDGEEDAAPAQLGDTQDEEMESEEMWRKERHEREMFLRQMAKEQDENNESLNTSMNRTAIIKASLNAKAVPLVFHEPSPVQEKKTAKDIPSPVKKPFTLVQPNFRGSILARGSGALARLAAIAAPIAGDDKDSAKVGSLAPGKRNFVFTAVSPTPEDQPKVSKRKIENVGTPQMMKKLKTEEKQEIHRSRLLERIEL